MATFAHYNYNYSGRVVRQILLRMRKLFIDVMRITCARGCTEVSGNALVSSGSRGGEFVCVL